MWPPHLLHTRSARDEFIAAIVVPVVFGLITGLTLGWSEPVYLVLSFLGIAGGYAAGMEHDVALEGLYRGILGGLLFGTSILLAHQLSDAEPKAHLPHPEMVLVVITTLFGAVLGTLGARARAKRSSAAAT